MASSSKAKGAASKDAGATATPKKAATKKASAAKASTAPKKAATKKAPAAKKATAAKAPAAKKATAAKAPAAKKATAAKAPAAKKATAGKTPAAKKASAAKAPAAKKATAAKTPAAKKSSATEKRPATDQAASAAPAKASARSTMKTGTSLSTEGKATGKPVQFGSPDYPFDRAFLDAQVELLKKERETLLDQATTLKSEADALARDREPGDVQFDDESGEGDTLAVERDMDLARAASAMQTVDEIDAALGRIDKGVYGMCEYSGLPIPKERLEVIPYARERVEYKTRSFR